jgi:hypothetical protein
MGRYSLLFNHFNLIGFWQELIIRLLNDRVPVLLWKYGALFRCNEDKKGLILVEKVFICITVSLLLFYPYNFVNSFLSFFRKATEFRSAFAALLRIYWKRNLLICGKPFVISFLATKITNWPIISSVQKSMIDFFFVLDYSHD